jgi:hypothetical protein
MRNLIVMMEGLLLVAVLLGADAPQQWGTVKGQIVWAGGTIPAPKKANVDKDQNVCLKDGDVFLEDWVTNKDNKGIRWVFVWLVPDPPDPKAKLPIHPSLQKPKEKQAELDQPCCQFIPHALAMREGQDLVARNSAPIAHNVRWTGHPLKNPGGNLIVPPKGQHVIQGLKADRFPVMVACDIHKWMSATVRVFDHPYYAVTDKDGKFEIKNAPAGPCRLMVWHPPVGYRGGKEGRTGEKIEIKADDTTDLRKLELKDNYE